MWFKNLKLYRLDDSFSLDQDKLEQQLGEFAFRGCGSQELATMGWVAPIKGGESLFHTATGAYWFVLQKQERLLPSSVVNSEVEEKAAQIEHDTGAPVGKKQRQDIKQEVIHRLLPQAFTKNTVTHGCMIPDANAVIVDAGSDGKAEAFLAMLRKSLGSLPVTPLVTRSIEADLTHWLQSNEVPEDIEILPEAEFKLHGEDAAVIRSKNQDLGSEEMQAHLAGGMMVQKLGIAWDETLTAVLQEDLTVKRLKFSDVIKEQNDDIPKDQLAAKLDADFALMAGELARFSQRLDALFAKERENGL